MELHYDSIHLKAESDKYESVSVVAVIPTRRDIWSIFRGRYQPKVKRSHTITAAGASRVLKENYTDRISDALSQKSVFMQEPE